MKIKFNHVGIVVPSSGFLVDLFKSYGLNITDSFFDEEENVNTIEMDGIHILEPLSKDSPINSFIKNQKLVLNHISFETSDLEFFKEKIDVPILHEGENNSYKFFFILKDLPHDKKILLEFIEKKVIK